MTNGRETEGTEGTEATWRGPSGTEYRLCLDRNRGTLRVSLVSTPLPQPNWPCWDSDGIELTLSLWQQVLEQMSRRSPVALDSALSLARFMGKRHPYTDEMPEQWIVDVADLPLPDRPQERLELLALQDDDVPPPSPFQGPTTWLCVVGPTCLPVPNADWPELFAVIQRMIQPQGRPR